jgi:hypothetical protein
MIAIRYEKWGEFYTGAITATDLQALPEQWRPFSCFASACFREPYSVFGYVRQQTDDQNGLPLSSNQTKMQCVMVKTGLGQGNRN